MDDSRVRKYVELKGRIGNTPLIRYSGSVSNGNSLWIKRECDNPFGSHYDRVYLALFKYFEENKGLKPGMNVLETSSGSAGVSFAGVGRELGYNCYVMIPDDLIKQKRIEAIKSVGGIIIPTPAGEDIQGFTKERIFENIRKYYAKFLNHSMGIDGANNEVTLCALEDIAIETCGLHSPKIDIFVAGIGNGSSVVGPGRFFRRYNPDIKIIGYKPRKSGKSEYPGLMNQDGLKRMIDFPHIREAEKMMDKVVLIDDWNGVGYQDLGRSANAGIKVALDFAKEVSDKNILVLGYDKAERY
ncbi:MAG: pyridoxal-phosphate dependent enzyme [archaeon]